MSLRAPASASRGVGGLVGRRVDRRAGGASGFTLLEMVLALGVMTLVLGAMTGAVTVALRAMPRVGSAGESLIEATRVIDRFAAEIRAARSVTLRSGTGVTFTLHDRTGDSIDETVRWSWSGAAGGNLVREMNSTGAVVIARNVRSFSLSYRVVSDWAGTGTVIAGVRVNLALGTDATRPASTFVSLMGGPPGS